MTMRRVLPCLCAAAAALALSAAPASARQADGRPNSLERGRRSLTFSLPDGGGASFGYWVMRSDRTNLGIDLGLSVNTFIDDDDDDPMGYLIRVGPALRRYVVLDAPVAPFVQGGIDVGFGSQPAGAGSQRRLSVQPTVGLGVEWFPVRHVSIGGYAGVGIGYTRNWTDPETGPGPDPVQTLTVGTFTSALALRIYFGGWGEDQAGAVAEGN